jgi:hypothetical protein
MTNRRTHSHRLLVALVLMLAVVASVLPVAPLAPTALAQAISEAEPNNTAETAQVLERIGRESPVEARIDVADVDWFSFQAIQGRAYVIELFDVANTLNGGFCRTPNRLKQTLSDRRLLTPPAPSRSHCSCSGAAPRQPAPDQWVPPGS